MELWLNFKISFTLKEEKCSQLHSYSMWDFLQRSLLLFNSQSNPVHAWTWVLAGRLYWSHLSGLTQILSADWDWILPNDASGPNGIIFAFTNNAFLLQTSFQWTQLKTTLFAFTSTTSVLCLLRVPFYFLSCSC